jgi:ubiquinone/menaquinone biosynthesis C-methylase UbiE
MRATSEELFARDAHHYFQMDLTRPERVLLDRVGTRWGQTDMLDLGVGPGRTAYTFGAICRRYVGIDYVPRMIELSRERVDESDRCRFETGDARDLSRFRDGEFEVVLFSFNGIDNISHADRLRVLAEVHRVLRPGGTFLFSSHSLNVFPFRLAWPEVSWRRPFRALRWYGGAVRRWIRLRAANRSVDARAVRARGWSLLVSDAHGYGMQIYHVTPAEQRRQLRDAGFMVDVILDQLGRPPADADASTDDWLHYLCHTVARGHPGTP